MISICIPTYNNDCTRLLEALKKELVQLNNKIEVLVADDGSTVHHEKNEKKSNDFGFRYIKMKENFGRVLTRIRLAKQSRNSFILFIDSDMTPANPHFIKNYLDNIAAHPNVQAFFGGYSYENTIVNKNLRYIYGKNREQKKANYRTKIPYKFIFSGNMLISKKLFVKSSKIFDDVYGLDLLLGSSLKKSNIPILHIDNETTHHGIDDNNLFLSKTKSSSASLRNYYEANIIGADQNNLIYVFEKLRKYRLNFIFCNSFLPIGKCLHYILKLYGKPLILFDWYRLYYFSNPKKS